MLPIRNISYLSLMCCNFWEKCINRHKIGQGCSTPLKWYMTCGYCSLFCPVKINILCLFSFVFYCSVTCLKGYISVYKLATLAHFVVAGHIYRQQGMLKQTLLNAAFNFCLILPNPSKTHLSCNVFSFSLCLSFKGLHLDAFSP